MQPMSVINLSILDELTGGDNAVKKEVFELFINQSKEDLNQFKACAQNEDWETVARVANKMKDATTALGIQDLQPILESLESHESDETDKAILQQYVSLTEMIYDQALTEAEQSLKHL